MDKFFETCKTFKRSVNPEFEKKVDVQNRTFGWIHFRNSFFKLLNDDDKKCNKNSTVNFSSKMSYLIQLLVSIISHYSQRFSADFLELLLERRHLKN